MSENKKNKVNEIYKNDRKFYVVFFTANFIALLGIILPPLGILGTNILILVATILIASLAVLGINANFDLKNGKIQIDSDRDGINDTKK